MPMMPASARWNGLSLRWRAMIGCHPCASQVALRAVMRQNNPRLADERLEALRRMAVLAWHQSFQVAASELRAFFDAGFTHGQYETMMASIAAARTQRRRRR